MDRWDSLKVDPDTSRPILLPNETELVMLPKTAIYEGDRVIPAYQDGNLTLTNHRFLWRDSHQPLHNSISLSLSLVDGWEHKAGFLTSSPKVILRLLPKSAQSSFHPITPLSSTERTNNCDNDAKTKPTNWKCHICETENPPEELAKCSICGVPRQSSKIEKSLNPPEITWPCNICTFLNAKSTLECEMCGSPRRKPAPLTSSPSPTLTSSPSPTLTSSPSPTLTSSPSPTLTSSPSPTLTNPPLSTLTTAYIKFSFRGGGQVSNLLNNLQITQKRADWKVQEAGVIARESRSFDPAVAGITGLMKQVDLKQQTASESLSMAFDDLNSLMNKAAEMVSLAETIMNKLNKREELVDSSASSSSSSSTSTPTVIGDQEERDFRKMLLEIGIGSAITREMTSGNDSIFLTELSRQLADFVRQLWQRRHSPVIGLADVFCLYNRARGTNLVSPADLYNAVSLFEPLNLPVRMMRLESGLIVLQSASTQSQVIQIIWDTLNDVYNSLDAIQLSRQVNISLSMANLFLKQAEQEGVVCRDETPFGIIRYYKNLFI